MTKRLLLLSNSTHHGQGYLDHAEEEIRDFFPAGTSILFVPYALHDRDGYASVARDRLTGMGFTVDSIHEGSDPVAAVRAAQAIFIGGGNTFRLLNEMYTQRIIDPIRERMEGGMPYMGASAGTNVATVSLKTTNDMPIVQPPSFDALRLVPFNINAHFIDADPASTHMGETREVRIAEFHEENPQPVLGIREGTAVRVEGDEARLWGERGAKLFQRDQEPLEIKAGDSLDHLLTI